MTRPLIPSNQIWQRLGWTWSDGVMVLATIALLFAIVYTASQFTGEYKADLAIDTRLSELPSYTLQSLLRMALAYVLSLGFALSYAYSAYRSSLAAQVLIPLLDILQSIPVLSFLPGVVLALIALFPGQRIGIELAAIVLIFTGMTWNMTWSFYQSLSSLPRELKEVSHLYKLNVWQRFWTLELPAGAIGLAWNSVMSVAGGWFFLMAIESFTLGNRSFRLPGLGSFLATAADRGDMRAIAGGLAALVGTIVVIDFLLWRPLIAWVEKFKLEMVPSESVPESAVLNFLRRSPTLRAANERLAQSLSELLARRMTRLSGSRSPLSGIDRLPLPPWSLTAIVGGGFAVLVLWGTIEAALLLRSLPASSWHQVGIGMLFTAARVALSLLISLCIAVPLGVAIGRNRKLAQVLQPVIQILASVPATALFPVFLIYLVRFGGGLQIGSILLMVLGTVWYILFNAIAGAQSIPGELFEVASAYKLSRLQRWQVVILPGIFPYVIVGAIAAVGGAWNASVVSEYVHFQGHTLKTPGLGATISTATAAGNLPLLLAATAAMSLLVVLTNRLVWRRLYQLAQDKYQVL